MGRRALRKIDPALDLSRHLLVRPAVSVTRVAGATPQISSADSTGALPQASDEATTTERVGTLPIPWDAMAVFGRGAPLEVEVGSGKGMFLARAATERPDHDFLGIELANKYAHFAAARLARAGLTNARLLSGDALTFFRELPDAVSVVEVIGLAAVHVYFPDPWWKKRHRKRRVMSAAFIVDIARTLAPGGTLHFWTDVEEYFTETLALIAEEPRLSGPLPMAERPADGSGEGEYLTHFDRRMKIWNQPVYRAEFRGLRREA